ncbi:MAG: DUF364 domain-containing protein [Candidatus Omnitrophota bacterium]|nr:DUF364 domain-containing protein [Candidatus Omnitrophota bacterium]
MIRLLEEAKEYFFSRSKTDHLLVRKALLGEVCAVQLENGKAGFTYSDKYDRRFSKHRRLVTESFVFKRDFSLGFKNRKIMPYSEGLTPIYTCILSALSKDYYLQLRKKFSYNNRYIPIVGLPSMGKLARIIQIGYDCRYLTANIAYNPNAEIILYDKNISQRQIFQIKKISRQIDKRCKVIFRKEYAVSQRELKECAILYITASAINNGTLDKILAHRTRGMIYMYCNAAAIVPEILLSRNISFIHTSHLPDYLFPLALKNYKQFTRTYYCRKNLFLYRRDKKELKIKDFDVSKLIRLMRKSGVLYDA